MAELGPRSESAVVLLPGCSIPLVFMQPHYVAVEEQSQLARLQPFVKGSEISLDPIIRIEIGRKAEANTVIAFL